MTRIAIQINVRHRELRLFSLHCFNQKQFLKTKPRSHQPPNIHSQLPLFFHDSIRPNCTPRECKTATHKEIPRNNSRGHKNLYMRFSHEHRRRHRNLFCLFQSSHFSSRKGVFATE